MYAAKIIAQSVANGKFLTTMQITYPRIVHSEFMTHRVFSRNAASSRAIPYAKMVEAVIMNPFIPVEFGKNQAGMQAREVFTGAERLEAEAKWLAARDAAVREANKLHDMGIHKQIVNRIIEPWSWITVVVTSSLWNNFFSLRCHPDAQPEIRKIAEMMRDAYDNEQYLYSEKVNEDKGQGVSSITKELEKGQWHLPYITDDLRERFDEEVLKQISVGQCARVSYLRQEDTEDPSKSIELYKRLYDATPKHLSPFEHVATPAYGPNGGKGNLRGWNSLRSFIFMENGEPPVNGIDKMSDKK